MSSDGYLNWYLPVSLLPAALIYVGVAPVKNITKEYIVR